MVALRLLALSCALLTSGAFAQPRELESAFPRQWYSLAIDGQRIGHAWHEVRSEKGSQIYSQHVRIDVTQFRQTSTIERNIRIERATNGSSTRISADARMGADRGAWSGEIIADASSMTVAASESRGAATVKLPAGLYLPDQLSAALKPLWSGDVAQISVPILDSARAVATQLQAAVVPDDAAASQNLTRVHTRSRSGALSDSEDLWFDRAGHLVRREQAFFGTLLTWQACQSDCERVDAPFDPMARLVVRSPYHIPPNVLSGPIRYVIARADGAAPGLVATPDQAVMWDGPRAVVTICKGCGVVEAATAEELERFLGPNAWVQSTHKTIVRLAQHAGSSDVPTARRMSRLKRLVQQRMTGPVDYLGYSTAVEAWRSRSGDCTEFAVLLAALARAEGIPTRIVTGLVYADRFSGKKDVFSPHAWVQVWDVDRWVSHDAALDGFDATHIAMAIGDGDPEEFAQTFRQLAQWRIEKAGIVRPTH